MTSFVVYISRVVALISANDGASVSTFFAVLSVLFVKVARFNSFIVTVLMTVVPFVIFGTIAPFVVAGESIVAFGAMT